MFKTILFQNVFYTQNQRFFYPKSCRCFKKYILKSYIKRIYSGVFTNREQEKLLIYMASKLASEKR